MKHNYAIDTCLHMPIFGMCLTHSVGFGTSSNRHIKKIADKQTLDLINEIEERKE